MNTCAKCGYYHLMAMIKCGRPLQYFGDIPCNRCRHLQSQNSEFTEKREGSIEDLLKDHVADA